jgi:hypothetical protein
VTVTPLQCHYKDWDGSIARPTLIPTLVELTSVVVLSSSLSTSLLCRKTSQLAVSGSTRPDCSLDIGPVVSVQLHFNVQNPTYLSHEHQAPVASVVMKKTSVFGTPQKWKQHWVLTGVVPLATVNTLKL